MSALFNTLGYEIGHEQMKDDGISSWLYGANLVHPFSWNYIKNKHALKIKPNIKIRENVKFNHIFCIIRNPETALKSIIYTENVKRVSLEYRLTGLNITNEDLRHTIEVIIKDTVKKISPAHAELFKIIWD